MNSIQPVCLLGSRNEELTGICVLAGIRHAQHSRLIMTVQKVLIRKRGGSIDALLSRTIALDKVSTLHHEILNHTMKGSTLVTSRLFIDKEFTCTQLSKVFTCFGALLKDIGVRIMCAL